MKKKLSLLTLFVASLGISAAANASIKAFDVNCSSDSDKYYNCFTNIGEQYNIKDYQVINSNGDVLTTGRGPTNRISLHKIESKYSGQFLRVVFYDQYPNEKYAVSNKFYIGNEPSYHLSTDMFEGLQFNYFEIMSFDDSPKRYAVEISLPGKFIDLLRYQEDFFSRLFVANKHGSYAIEAEGPITNWTYGPYTIRYIFDKDQYYDLFNSLREPNMLFPFLYSCNLRFDIDKLSGNLHHCQFEHYD